MILVARSALDSPSGTLDACTLSSLDAWFFVRHARSRFGILTSVTCSRFVSPCCAGSFRQPSGSVDSRCLKLLVSARNCPMRRVWLVRVGHFSWASHVDSSATLQIVRSRVLSEETFNGCAWSRFSRNRKCYRLLPNSAFFVSSWGENEVTWSRRPGGLLFLSGELENSSHKRTCLAAGDFPTGRVNAPVVALSGIRFAVL